MFYPILFIKIFFIIFTPIVAIKYSNRFNKISLFLYFFWLFTVFIIAYLPINFWYYKNEINVQSLVSQNLFLFISFSNKLEFIISFETSLFLKVASLLNLFIFFSNLIAYWYNFNNSVFALSKLAFWELVWDIKSISLGHIAIASSRSLSCPCEYPPINNKSLFSI